MSDFNEEPAISGLKRAFKYESDVFSTFFLKYLAKAKWVTNVEQLHVNKLVVLQKAIEVGLDVPKTLITNNLNDLKHFFLEYPSIITKPVSEMEIIQFDNRFFSNHTSIVQEKDLETDRIPLTLFQESIEKEFEIRTFYFYGKCFSMAIFSQNDDQTKVDFRVYNHAKPNRRVPYTLESSLENKIIELMHSLKLDTGSIDFIKSKNDKLFFLEVNPVGQFGMVSYPCNYYLEEGDLVFARTGASVGKSYLYNSKDGKLVFAGFLIRVKPNQEKLLSQYLKSFVKTKSYWSWGDWNR